MDRLCAHCQGKECRRLNREGFLERRILPLLGYFPWECSLCRKKFFLRADGHRVRTEP
jgi:hypothetical protein